MDSFSWDSIRTVLDTVPLPLPDHQAGGGNEATPTRQQRPGALVVWKYLIQLSEPEVDGPDLLGEGRQTRPDRLRHFKAADFKLGWEAPPQTLGAGASYTVEKWTLTEPAPARGSGNKSGSDASVVAVKRLNFQIRPVGLPPAAEEEQLFLVATVLKELRILTHPPLRTHPNIVSLMGYRSEFTNPDLNSAGRSLDLSLVAEFSPFGTLKEFLLDGPDDAKTADLLVRARFMYDIASGLEALHGCGIAHGDVKIENTLVFRGQPRQKPFVAKLSDFGHSIVDLDKEDSPHNKRYLGTRLLNAPEVRSPHLVHDSSSAAPSDAEAFYKCDIYSYGLLVWELILGGKRFFTALGEQISSSEDEDHRVSQLAALPRDSLLLAGVASLRERSHDVGDDRTILRTLSRVLQATLKDDPTERKSAREVVDIFRQQRTFRHDDTVKRMSTEDKPRPCPLPPSSVDVDNTEFLPEMPASVQQDVVTQLQASLETAGSAAVRRSILYDLAMCALAGWVVDDGCPEKVLTWLSEAAQLGSPEALAIVFRLHQALQREVPPELLAITHPMKEIEVNLASLESKKSGATGSYFATRIGLFEQLYQREARDLQYDIILRGETILSGVRLERLADILSAESCRLDVGCLECASRPDGDTNRDGNGNVLAITGRLLHVAARLGLLPIVRFLFAQPGSTSKPSLLDLVSPASDDGRNEDLLTAACHGGHLDVLEFLLSQGAEPNLQYSRTALHWLVMFSADEVDRALSLLLKTSTGLTSLRLSEPQPGTLLDFQHCRLRGTPFEFAIGVNNVRLVEAILSSTGNDPVSAGWTADTFRLAISLHLSPLLPRFVSLEQSYRCSLGFVDPRTFGLFHLAKTPPDDLSLLLIHGNKARAELEASMDHLGAIPESNIFSLFDEDESGSTALTHAVRNAPCHMNTDIISALLARHAEFGFHENRKWIVLNVLAKRRARDARAITTLLLEAGLLPHVAALLSIAASSGNAAILEAVLDFPGRNGTQRLDARSEVVEGDQSASLLFYCISLPSSADLMRVLLDRGADPASVFDDRNLVEAAITLPECDVATLDLLIERGAPLVLDDGLTVVHQASVRGGHVGRVHVLLHLLRRHERLRALINHPGPSPLLSPVPPLLMACLAVQPDAVQALLQEGATVDISNDQEPSRNNLAVAISVGRRPWSSPYFQGDRADEEALYRWRLNAEMVALALLNWADPTHGRSQLHVAADLGSYRRVVELVEQRGLQVFVGDCRNLTPLAYVEDAEACDDDDGSAYTDNLDKLRHYLTTKLIEEICSDLDDVDNPEPVRGLLSSDNNASPQAYEEGDGGDRADLRAKIEQLNLAQDALKTGSGYDSPADLAKKLSDLLRVQRETLGDTDRKTLSTMRKLGVVYCRLGRFDEAEKLQVLAIAAMEDQQASLDSNDEAKEELYRAYTERAVTLCGQGKAREAWEYLFPLSIKAYDSLGEMHLASLAMADTCSDAMALDGRVEEAISQLWVTLEVYQAMRAEAPLLADPPGGLSLAILRVKSSLIGNFCSLKQFAAAREVMEPGDSMLTLDSAKGHEFLDVFESLVNGVAAPLELNGQHEVAEHIYKHVIDACLRRHRNRKSYCTATAMERLAIHYLRRGLYAGGDVSVRQEMYAKEGAARQKLVDFLTITLGARDPAALAATVDLAGALARQDLWDEAGLLQERVIRSLEDEEQQQVDKKKTPDQQPPDAILLKAKVGFSRSLQRQGKTEIAERLAREAVIGSRSRFGDDADETVAAEVQLGQLLLALGGNDRVSECVAVRQRHVDLAVLRHGELHDKTLQAVESLALVLLRHGRLPEAEAQARRGLRISQGMPPSSITNTTTSNDRVVAQSLKILAGCLRKSGDADAAAELYRQSILKEKDANGGRHNQISIDSLNTLTELLMDAGRYSDAEPLLREILVDAPGAFGSSAEPPPPVVLAATKRLARICDESISSRLDEAISLHEASVALARRIHDATAAETIDCLDNLVCAYNRAGDRAWDAKDAAVEVLAWRREHRGEFHYSTVDILYALCTIYDQLEMWPEAERTYRTIVCFLERSDDPEDHEQAAEYMGSISVACRKQGPCRQGDAERFARRALEYWKRQKGNKRSTLEAMATLAFALADGATDAAKLADAEGLAKEILGKCATSEGTSEEEDDDYCDDDAQELTIEAEAALAFVYRQQGRFQEAEVLQLRVVEWMDDLDTEDEEAGINTNSIEQARSLFALYVKMGRYDAALGLGHKTMTAAKECSRGAEGENDKKGNDSYLDDMGVLWSVLVDLAELQGPLMGAWEEARRTGELALKWVMRCKGPGQFEYEKIYLSVLQALRAVYEAVSEETKLREVESAIKRAEDNRKSRLEQHLASLEADELRFQREQ